MDETIKHAQSLESSVEVHTAITDVSDASAVESFVKSGVEKFGRIDHSIHCAGIAGEMGPTSEASVQNYEKVMDVNVKGVWVFSKYVMGQMKKQEPRKTELGMEVRGSIINIASLLGLVGHPNCSAYVGSKHGE